MVVVTVMVVTPVRCCVRRAEPTVLAAGVSSGPAMTTAATAVKNSCAFWRHAPTEGREDLVPSILRASLEWEIGSVRPVGNAYKKRMDVHAGR